MTSLPDGGELLHKIELFDPGALSEPPNSSARTKVRATCDGHFFTASRAVARRGVVDEAGDVAKGIERVRIVVPAEHTRSVQASDAIGPSTKDHSMARPFRPCSI